MFMENLQLKLFLIPGEEARTFSTVRLLKEDVLSSVLTEEELLRLKEGNGEKAYTRNWEFLE